MDKSLQLHIPQINDNNSCSPKTDNSANLFGFLHVCKVMKYLVHETHCAIQSTANNHVK